MTDTDTMKFGPEWLRNLSGGGGSGSNVTSPPPSGFPSAKYKLADHRYGREELLALWVSHSEPPEELQEFPQICNEGILRPLANIEFTEEEMRLTSQSVNSGAVMRLMSRGGEAPMKTVGGAPGRRLPERGRGRGRGRGDGGFFPREYDDGPGPFGRGFAGRGGRHTRAESWEEREGFERPFEDRGPARKPSGEMLSRSMTNDNWRSRKDEEGQGQEDGGDWRRAPTRDRWGSGPRGGVRDGPSWRDRDGNYEPRGSYTRGFSRGGGSYDRGYSGGRHDDGYYGGGGRGWDRNERGGHRGSYNEEEEEIPEWARDANDDIGTFDSSGAFMSNKDVKKDKSNATKHDEKGRKPEKNATPSPPRQQKSEEKEIQEVSEKKGETPVAATKEPPSPQRSAAKQQRRPTRDTESPMEQERVNRTEKVEKSERSEKERSPPSQDRVPEEEPKQIEREQKEAPDKEIEQQFDDDMEGLVAQWTADTEEDDKGAVAEQPNLTDKHVDVTSHAAVAAAATSQDRRTSDDEEKWLYRDPQGEVQGPFHAHEMAEWFSAGYFTMNLQVRRACDEPFLALGDLIKMCGRVPFMPRHSPPPMAAAAAAQDDLSSEDAKLNAMRAQQQYLLQLRSLQQAQLFQQMLSQLQQQHEAFAKLPIMQQQQYAMELLTKHRMLQQQQPQQATGLRPAAPMMPTSLPEAAEATPPLQRPLSQPNDAATTAATAAAMFVHRSTSQPVEPAVTGDSIWDIDHQPAPPQPAATASPHLDEQQLVEQKLRMDRAAAEEQRKRDEDRRLHQQQQEQAELLREEMRRLERVKMEEELRRRDEERVREEETRLRAQQLEEIRRRREEEDRRRLALQEELERTTREEQMRREAEERRQNEEASARRKREEEEAMKAREAIAIETRKTEELRRRQEKAEKETAKRRQEEALRRLKDQQQLQNIKLPATASWANQNFQNGANSSSNSSQSSQTLAEIQAQTQKAEAANQQRKKQEAELAAAVSSAQQQQEKATWAANRQQAAAHGSTKSLLEIQQEQARQEALAATQRSQELSKQQASLPLGAAAVWSGTTSSSTWAQDGAWGSGSSAAAGKSAQSVGFWDDAAATVSSVPAAAPSTKKNTLNNNQHFPALSTTSKKKASPKESPSSRKQFESDAVQRLFQAAVENQQKDDLQLWCEQSLTSFKSQLDIPTFVSYLVTLEQPHDIEDYIKGYLGESKSSFTFAQQFIDKQRKKLQSRSSKSDSIWGPNTVISPSVSADGDLSLLNSDKEFLEPSNKTKKKRMRKVDPHLLGFSATSAPDRVNMGEIDTVGN